MAKGISLALLVTGVWGASLLALVQVRPPASYFRTATLLYIATVPILAGVYIATPPDLGWLPAPTTRSPFLLGLMNAFIVQFLLYAAWMVGYYCVDRPLTVRLLFEIERMAAADLERVRAAYPPEAMIRERLESMRENGWVTRPEGERYVLTGRGRFLGRAIILLRRLTKVPHYITTSKMVCPPPS